MNGGYLLLLGAGLYAHAHPKTAQCLLGHFTVTMEYTAMSSTAVKWRQKGCTGVLGLLSFPHKCTAPKLYMICTHTRKKNLMEISHKAVKFQQLLSTAFRDVYAPSGSLGPSSTRKCGRDPKVISSREGWEPVSHTHTL